MAPPRGVGGSQPQFFPLQVGQAQVVMPGHARLQGREGLQQIGHGKAPVEIPGGLKVLLVQAIQAGVVGIGHSAKRWGVLRKSRKGDPQSKHEYEKASHETNIGAKCCVFWCVNTQYAGP